MRKKYSPNISDVSSIFSHIFVSLCHMLITRFSLTLEQAVGQRPLHVWRQDVAMLCSFGVLVLLAVQLCPWGA